MGRRWRGSTRRSAASRRRNPEYSLSATDEEGGGQTTTQGARLRGSAGWRACSLLGWQSRGRRRMVALPPRQRDAPVTRARRQGEIRNEAPVGHPRAADGVAIGREGPWLSTFQSVFCAWDDVKTSEL